MYICYIHIYSGSCGFGGGSCGFGGGMRCGCRMLLLKQLVMCNRADGLPKRRYLQVYGSMRTHMYQYAASAAHAATEAVRDRAHGLPKRRYLITSKTHIMGTYI